MPNLIVKKIGKFMLIFSQAFSGNRLQRFQKVNCISYNLSVKRRLWIDTFKKNL